MEKDFVDKEFNLLNDIEKISNEFKVDIKKKKELISELIQIFKEREWINDISKSDIKQINEPLEIYGIDGSHKFFKGIGTIYYSTWSTVSVKKLYPNSIRKKDESLVIEKGIHSYNLSNLEESHTQKLRSMELECGIHDIPQDERNAKILAENDMLEKETDAIKKVNGDKNKFIFIDGPLVDPPKNSSDDYIRMRVKIIKDHLQKGTRFYCIVKRIFNDFYIQSKTKTLNLDTIKKLKIFYNDSELLEGLYIHYNWGKKIASDIIKLNNINLDHKKYSERGLDIYSFYLKLEPKGSVIRIDYPLLKNDSRPELDDIIAVIASQINPGYNLPEPIILAHFLCNKYATECFNLFHKMLNNWAKDFPNYLVAIKNINDLKSI